MQTKYSMEQMLNTSELLQLCRKNEIFRKKLSNAYFRGERWDRFKWLYNVEVNLE